MTNNNILRKDRPIVPPAPKRDRSARIQWGQQRDNLASTKGDENTLRSEETYSPKSALRGLGLKRPAKSVRFWKTGKAEDPAMQSARSSSVVGRWPSMPDHAGLGSGSSAPFESQSQPEAVAYIPMEPYVSVWLNQPVTPVASPQLPLAAEYSGDPGWETT